MALTARLFRRNAFHFRSKPYAIFNPQPISSISTSYQANKFLFSTTTQSKNESEYQQEQDKEEQHINPNSLYWKLGLGTLAAFGISIFIFQQQIRAQDSEPIIEATDPQKHSLREQGLGKGKWTMLDCEDGKAIDSTAFLGKYLIVYFGFTLCPDVCPVELSKMANV